MINKKALSFMAVYMTLGLPFVLTSMAFATTAGVSNVESFIKSIITVIAGLAGLIATGFFVMGGLTYITSSGNPELLDRAKRTLMFSGMGLAITIAAFVISNIIVTLATNAFGSS